MTTPVSLTSSSSGHTGLHIACEIRNIPLVKKYVEVLLRNGNSEESLRFILGKNGSGLTAKDIAARDTSQEGREILGMLQQAVAQLQGNLSRGTRSTQSTSSTSEQCSVVPRLRGLGGMTPPIFAKLLQEDMIGLTERIDLGDDPNAMHFGETLLTYATLEANIEAVKILLGSSTIDVNRTNSKGETPLDVAFLFDYKEIAKVLCEYGGLRSRVCDDTTSSSTPIRRSPRLSSLALVPELVPNAHGGAFHHSTAGENAMPPIFEAVDKGNRQDLEQCLEKGEDPNKLYRGQTPLMRAIVMGNFELFQILLGSPYLRIAAQNAQGMTALEFALQLPDRGVFVQSLLQANDAYIAHREKILAAPLESSPVTASSSSTELPPLFHAIQSRDPSLLGNRLMTGQDPNQIFNGDTPLTFAISQSRFNAVRSLCAAPRVDVNRQNGKGQTPLTTAVGMGNLEIVTLLVHKGADPHLPNKEGETPDALAARRGLVLIQTTFVAAELLKGLSEEEFLEMLAANQI